MKPHLQRNQQRVVQTIVLNQTNSWKCISIHLEEPHHKEETERSCPTRVYAMLKLYQLLHDPSMFKLRHDRLPPVTYHSTDRNYCRQFSFPKYGLLALESEQQSFDWIDEKSNEMRKLWSAPSNFFCEVSHKLENLMREIAELWIRVIPDMLVVLYFGQIRRLVSARVLPFCSQTQKWLAPIKLQRNRNETILLNSGWTSSTQVGMF